MSSSAPSSTWTPEDLRHLDGRRELEIAAPLADGRRGPWTPVWVVVSAGAVFVRTWWQRDTGWYGRAVASRRAFVRVSGDSVEVSVEVVGPDDIDTIDAAYGAKYGITAAASMVTAEAAASTLRLERLLT